MDCAKDIFLKLSTLARASFFLASCFELVSCVCGLVLVA